MSRRRSRSAALTAAASVVALLAAACADREPPRGQGLGLASVLGGGDDAGFARATEPVPLRFPRDHGAHPAFRTEWWYVTGNVGSDTGRRFGVQLVFFRQALAAAPPERTASLAARDVILAHAAVTDVDGAAFFAEERMARLAGGMAALRGGDAASFRVECADWSAVAAIDGDGFLPQQLRASGRGFAFDLQLLPGTPPVLQGDRGLSKKGALPGNASIYYSMTRLPLRGTIRVGESEHRVEGSGWVDREWSTSALAPDQVGWDWFALQLDNGDDVMWYRLRRRDGSVDPASSGILVSANGTRWLLQPAMTVTTPSGTWTASDGGAAYPAKWRLQSASPRFDLQIDPVLPDQELRLFVRYWEGAVAVRGTRDGKAVSGRGYLEMTGYTTR